MTVPTTCVWRGWESCRNRTGEDERIDGLGGEGTDGRRALSGSESRSGSGSVQRASSRSLHWRACGVVGAAR